VGSNGAPSTPVFPHILLVDDDRDTRDMYVAGLSFFGCTVAAVGDAAHAHDCARRRRPDVIVTDVVMPEGDGWSLIKGIKADPATRDIPVVILTGHGAPALPLRARAEGCAAFLMKPCLPEQLAAELRRVLERTLLR